MVGSAGGWDIPQRSRHTAKLLGPVLKVGDVGLTPLVGGGVLAAPFGGDPPEVAARVLALGVVAHACCVCCVEREKPGVCEKDGSVVRGGGLGSGEDAQGWMCWMCWVWSALADGRVRDVNWVVGIVWNRQGMWGCRVARGERWWRRAATVI